MCDAEALCGMKGRFNDVESVGKFRIIQVLNFVIVADEGTPLQVVNTWHE